MSPEQYCQAKAARSGSSFYYSFLFLPPEQRRAIVTLYAFCREVDDAVDETSDQAVARLTLAWWRQELHAAYVGSPHHPVTQSLAAVVNRHPLPESRLQEIIDGMAMDLEQNRYLDFPSLRSYCYRVAGVVGILAAEIFGYHEAATLRFAEELGIAFQLTNIIRDVGEDARRGRVYLPLDEMKRFGVSVNDILSLQETESFYALMRYQTERARRQYQSALALLPQRDRRAQRPSLIMGAIYQALLNEIETDGLRVLKHRIALTPLRKLWIAWKTWIKA